MSRAATALGAIAGFAVRNRRATVGVALGLGALFALLAFTGLKPTAGTESLVPKAAEASRQTDAIKARFGDDSIVVMAQEDLQQLLLTTDIGRLLELEGCLGGNVPKGAKPYGGDKSPCARIAAAGSVKRVYGPATFLNEAANQITSALSGELKTAAGRVQKASDRARAAALKSGLSESAAAVAGQAAAQAEQQRSAAALARLQVQTGITGLPSIANSDFVSSIALDPGRGTGEPKQKFSYLFPSAQAALIQVKPKAGLSGSAKEQLTRDVQAATKMPEFKLKSGSYLVTGASVLAEGLANEVASAAVPLLVLAAALMALALGLSFPVRSRLLPLAMALLSAAFVFGGMALFGLSFTVAAVGGVPVLIGLAVDYAVQLHARTVETEAEGVEPLASGVEAARSGGPPIATAAFGTAAGFLALLLSPVPMVRGFGLVLVAGVGLALVCALTAGSAALAASAGSNRRTASAADWIDSAVAGAKEILFGGSGTKKVQSAVGSSRQAVARNPKRVLAVAVALAICGWAVEGSLTVESDITRLVPAGTPALKDLSALQDQTGVAGEVDVMITGDRVTDPVTLNWLRQYREDALRAWGWTEKTGCRAGASLCPGTALTDLVGSTNSTAEANAAIEAIPEYFKSATISPDGKAVLTTFGIRLMPESDQQKVFNDLRKRADSAPTGVTTYVGGLPVVAAAANESLADENSRRLITLVALLASGLALGIALRSWRRLVVPLTATLLATGWASLALWLLGVDLNPLSAALGALVIAIGTEFAVLLSERERAESRATGDVEEALGRAFGTTGRAIAISGVTVVAGFGVLTLSDIRILSDFGLATVIDLLVALLAVALIVPAMVRVLSSRQAGKS